MTQVSLLLCLIVAGNDSTPMGFADLQIREPYRTYLLAEPLLMEGNSVTVIELEDGMKMLTAVASVVLRSDSPQHRLEAERICRVKALASIVARRSPVKLTQSVQVKERVVVSIEGGRERAESVSETIEIIRTRVSGATRQLPVVGRWMTHDRTVMSLAIGTIVDRTGKRVPDTRWSRPAQTARESLSTSR